MQRRRASLAALPLAVSLLASCGDATSDEYVIEDDPGSVEHVEGSDIGRVTLTDGAAGRLGVRTTPVTRVGQRLAVPDRAVFADPDGAWWVYTNPAPGVYVRHEIRLARHRQGLTLLSSGPGAGTEVVTVGVAELYGIEAEVGH